MVNNAIEEIEVATGGTVGAYSCNVMEKSEIEAAHAEEMAAGEATWAEFCSGPVAKIGAVGMTSMLLQQLGGMNVFMFYGPRVCEAVGLSGFLFTAIAGMVNFVATFPALLLVDRYGRARLLQCSAAGMMVACFGLAMIGNFAMKCRTAPPGARAWASPAASAAAPPEPTRATARPFSKDSTPRT